MSSIRGVIASILAATILLGSLPAVSLGQQPAPLVLMPDVVKEEDSPSLRPFDLYSVGSGVLTVARLPFNVGLCGAGALAGTLLFLLSLGSAYRGVTRTFEEGCAQKWFVRSDDIRPVRGTSGIFESRMERYQER
jgi:hypothetical protein